MGMCWNHKIIEKINTKGNEMDFLKNQKWNIAIISISILLLISAILHRGQFNLSKQQYIKSIFTPIEIFSMISIFVMNFVNVILLIKHIIKKQWKKLLITIGIIGFSTALMIISMQIDAPTLIYMT